MTRARVPGGRATRWRQLVALGLAWAAGPAIAQTGDADWSTLTVAVGPAVPVSDPYGEAWSLGPGGAFAVHTPAWGGRAHVSLWAFGADAARDGVPDFLTLVSAAGWGAGAEWGSVAVRLGVELGVVSNRFAAAGGVPVTNESEVHVGAYARAEVPIVGRLGAWADVGVRRIAYAEAATLASAGGGLAVRLDAPAWLRRALDQ